MPGFTAPELISIITIIAASVIVSTTINTTDCMITVTIRSITICFIFITEFMPTMLIIAEATC